MPTTSSSVSNTQSVWAVVVTSNRLKLLQQALDAIGNQTRLPQQVVVIDNDSSDGTAAWLATQKNIEFIRQRNLGSSGGFDTGINAALAGGADWIWCMDDDGIPARDQLEKLIEAGVQTKAGIIGPAVVTIDCPKELVFRQSGYKNMVDVRRAWRNQLLEDNISFNGMLIRKTTIQLVGGIKREMFIWGDDVEFCLRAKTAGISVGWWPGVVHYHPRAKAIYTHVPVFRYQMLTIKDEERRLIYYRNRAFLSGRYVDATPVRRDVIKQIIWHVIFERLSIISVFKLMLYLVDGYTNSYKMKPSRKYIHLLR